jgi:hypothetical protein
MNLHLLIISFDVLGSTTFPSLCLSSTLGSPARAMVMELAFLCVAQHEWFTN